MMASGSYDQRGCHGEGCLFCVSHSRAHETEALLSCHSTRGRKFERDQWLERFRTWDLTCCLSHTISGLQFPPSPHLPAPQHHPSPPDPLLLCLSSEKCRPPRDFNQTRHKSFSTTRHKPLYQWWARHFSRRNKIPREGERVSDSTCSRC